MTQSGAGFDFGRDAMSGNALPVRADQKGRRLRRAPDETDYEHRHFVNLAATVFLLAIGFAIIWTVLSIDRYETRQNCLASGRKDCVQIFTPPRGVRPLADNVRP